MRDLTLILLIKDRPDFLKRWVDYAVINKLNCPILISDGGKKKANKKTLSRLSNNGVEFKYLKFSYDKDYLQFCKKIFNSLKICKSEYVSLCADDDFYINESLNRGINFLKKNKNYVSYGASIITFGASNKYDQVNSIPTNFKRMYDNNKINNKSLLPRDRFFFFLKNSNFVIFHHIIKKKILIDVYKEILRCKLTIPNLIDLYGNSLIYCKGLVKTNKEIMRMKQYHPSSDAKSRDMNITLLDKNFFLENKELIDKLTKYISIKQKINSFFLKKEIKKKLDEHYFSGSSGYSKKENNFRKISKITYIKNLIMRKNITNIYYCFKKKLIIRNFKKFILKIDDKKIKKEINIILNYIYQNKLVL
jgi:glycosyltransferase domain-containing protein